MKALIEKKNDLITRAEDVLNQAKAENRELTEAEKQELTGIRDNVRSIEETIRLNDEIRALEREEAKEEEKEETKVTEEENKRAIEAQEEKEFDSYIRNVCWGRTTQERAGEVSPAAASAGALIPTTIVNRIIKKVYDICPILERSQKYNVKGKLEVPFYPADSNKITVAYATEFQDLASTSGKFDTIELSGYLAGALTKISRSLINNVNFNIVSFIVDEMAYAIKRFIEHELLIGTSGSVTGLSTLTNAVTAGSATALTGDDIIKLHDAIKDEYQNDAIWIMSPATRTALRLLKDGELRYLLQDDVSLPFGTSLLGKPVFVSDNMDDIATGKTVIYYGDMKGLATKFSEEINIEVLRELYAAQHAYGVVGWFEFDAKVIDEQQIAKLVMA